MSKKVIVPKQVYEDLISLQESGLINADDYYAVKDMTNKLGYYTTEGWLHNNKKIFEQGILYGIEPEQHSES
jgi:hypothetical protein